MGIRKSDYESYDYSQFWEDNKRLYEDRAERLALRLLLAGVDKDKIKCRNCGNIFIKEDGIYNFKISI